MVKYEDLAKIISDERLNKYLIACANDKCKAVQLYQLNQELASLILNIVSLFEISLRNAIDKEMTQLLGSNWMVNAFSYGIFSNDFDTLESALNDLNNKKKTYSNKNLIAGVSFGFWRYMFSNSKTDIIFQAIIEMLIDRCNQTDNTWFINLMNKIATMKEQTETEIFTYVVQQFDTYELNNIGNNDKFNTLNTSLLELFHLGTKRIEDGSPMNDLITFTKIINESKKLIIKKHNNSQNVRELCEGIKNLLSKDSIPSTCAYFKNLISHDKCWIKNFWIHGVFPNMPEKDSNGKFITNGIVSYEINCILEMRNRIAHQKSICFNKNTKGIDTQLVSENYNKILKYFKWLDVDPTIYFPNADAQINDYINEINQIKLSVEKAI